MKGEDLKNRLKSTAIPMSEIANKMGIMPQSLYSIFNSEDVKSGVLEKLSQVLEVPIAYFYGDSYTVQGNNNALATGDNSTASSSDDRLLALLMSKDAQLTLSMQQTSKAQEQITELIGMMKR
jgi:transcriptional regulator with XRE-family HTH domain